MKNNKLQNILRIMLGLMMIFAGISHLTFMRSEFQAQVPRWLPSSDGFMDFVVIASGIIEILFGLSLLLIKKKRRMVGVLLAIFFVLIFPGNISQYTNGISAFGLDTDNKRFLRLFFQPVLVVWALYSTGFFQKKNKYH